MAKINIDKFIADLIKASDYGTMNMLLDCLKEQGLECENGEILEIEKPQDTFQIKIKDKNEDERVIKALKEGFKYHQLFNPTFGGIPCIEIVNWLESQGEKKPADMVEPKFKVGDWICNGGGNPCKVNYIFGNCYEIRSYEIRSTEDIRYNKPISDVDANYHLWTIKDAKDGDVLAFDNSHIIIVKKSHNSTWGWRLSRWCHLLDGEFEAVEYHTKVEGLHPATKEQCDYLFKKMKEAGYTFDFEKKELKKIEPNDEESTLSEDERIRKGITQSLKRYTKCVEDGNDAAYAKDFLVKETEKQIEWFEKQCEQKSFDYEQKSTDNIDVCVGKENDNIILQFMAEGRNISDFTITKEEALAIAEQIKEIVDL